MQKYIQKNLIRSILVIFVVHTLAMFFHWYRLLWWFDAPMHFMGGFFCVWLVLYILNHKNNIVFNKSTVKNVLIWSFMIGFAWEWFEWGTDLYTGANAMHMLDSYSDLFFDMAGAVYAVLLLSFRVKGLGVKINKVEALGK